MKILAIADIDDLSWQYGSGEADVVVSCGDIDNRVILQAAAKYNCNKIFAVKGNHDSCEPFPDSVCDLHLRTEKYGGLTLGGLNGSWKYKPKGFYLYEQYEIKQFLSQFPPVNIFISHNSPAGIHECDRHVHQGFEGLQEYISKTKPEILIHGHQHINKETARAGCRIIGIYGYRLIEY